MNYDKDLNELCVKYGLSKPVAKEVLASHSQEEVKVILDFLSNYGKILTFN